MILHPQLKKDCIVVGQFELCLLLLINDSNYPWFVLVPQRENITEIYQLSDLDQQLLMAESSRLSRVISDVFHADKINIAALGNMVPQLHVHHVVRYTNDAAWPAPVWGAVPSKAYTDENIENILTQMKGSKLLGLSAITVR